MSSVSSVHRRRVVSPIGRASPPFLLGSTTIEPRPPNRALLLGKEEAHPVRSFIARASSSRRARQGAALCAGADCAPTGGRGAGGSDPGERHRVLLGKPAPPGLAHDPRRALVPRPPGGLVLGPPGPSESEIDADAWSTWRGKLFSLQYFTFDQDRFNTNAVGHPIAGLIYYQIARGSGLGVGCDRSWRRSPPRPPGSTSGSRTRSSRSTISSSPRRRVGCSARPATDWGASSPTESRASRTASGPCSSRRWRR